MPSRRTPVVVIGAGQAGLAMSAWLGFEGVDHVVLERGRIGQRWRDRWDSLTLLSPNAYNQILSTSGASGPDDGFLDRDGFVAELDHIAATVRAPVMEHVTVRRVVRNEGRWLVSTDRGDWSAAAVVVATGHCDLPHLPSLADRIPEGVQSLHSSDYRNPDQLHSGGDGVLVVGAGPSGQQIALELARAGRSVTLAVGRHTRMPRRHRGMELYWWLDQLGVLAQRTDQIADVAAARRAPSMVLSGQDGGRDLDLDVLTAAGVALRGRLTDIRSTGTPGPGDGGWAEFGADLPAHRAEADARCLRWLDRFDAWALDRGIDLPPDIYRSRLSRTAAVTSSPAAESPLPLGPRRVGAVVWATGYRRDYSWIDAGVFDADGEPVHQRGVTAAPGLCFLGLRWQHTRSSSFIGGVGDDARHLAVALARELPALEASSRPERAA